MAAFLKHPSAIFFLSLAVQWTAAIGPHR